MSQVSQRYLDELDTSIRQKKDEYKKQKKKTDIAVRKHETMVKKRKNLPNTTTNPSMINIPQLNQAVRRTYGERVEESHNLEVLAMEIKELKKKLDKALNTIMRRRGGKILKKSKSRQVTRKSRKVKKKSKQGIRKFRSK